MFLVTTDDVTKITVFLKMMVFVDKMLDLQRMGMLSNLRELFKKDLFLFL